MSEQSRNVKRQKKDGANISSGLQISPTSKIDAAFHYIISQWEYGIEEYEPSMSDTDVIRLFTEVLSMNFAGEFDCDHVREYFTTNITRIRRRTLLEFQVHKDGAFSL